MRIVFISDTHGLHDQVRLPEGDLLIHAGDVTSSGSETQVQNFIQWFEEQPFDHKVFVAGNHDFFLEFLDKDELRKSLSKNVHYLENDGTNIDGLNIWGSPITPEFFNWAFMEQRGEKIAEYWKMIPKKTDILITHGPPFEVLDLTYAGLNVGCEELAEYVIRQRPRYHVFGHIHEAAGELDSKYTHYVNASVVNFQYQVVNKPIVIDL